MNGIQQMHLDAIKRTTRGTLYNKVQASLEYPLCYTHADVTEQVAVEFAKFCLNKAKDLDTHTVYHNIDSTFQEFLKTKR